MIIEFYGLPGSGKTTLIQELVTTPGWIKVSFAGKCEIIRYFFWGCTRQPGIFIRAFFHYFARNKSLFYLWNFYIVQYAKYRKAQVLSKKNQYVLLDEGPLQNIISYPDKSLCKTELTSYLNIIPKSDKTIIFDVDEQQRKRRLRKRNHHQSWRKKHDNDQNWDVNMIETDMLFKKNIAADANYFLFSEGASLDAIISVLIK